MKLKALYEKLIELLPEPEFQVAIIPKSDLTPFHEIVVYRGEGGIEVMLTPKLLHWLSDISSLSRVIKTILSKPNKK